MEIKSKQKTLTGLFLKFAVLFCVNTFLILIGCTLLLMAAAFFGQVLPANYAETRLTEHTAEIQEAGNEPERWIPEGCTYGIYDEKGRWITGSFAEAEREHAWDQYRNESIFAEAQNYYRFIRQDNGNICIVKYSVYMKYAWNALNKILPAPELMSFILAGILFIVNAILLSRYFARKLNRQLEELRGITEKIAENDLEFQTSPSDIREIDGVMKSLSHLKDALKNSLSAQWDMEQQKQEQLASLTHDIKTPLTIIKGNAELLAESELSHENKECADYILSNASDIQKYLDRMKDVLYGASPEYEEMVFSCMQMEEIFREAAMQIGAAEKIPVSLGKGETGAAPYGKHMEGSGGSDTVAAKYPGDEMSKYKICCCPESLLRAWKNILSNGAEYTDKKKGMTVTFSLRQEDTQEYLEAVVRDYGPGFSPVDMGHADQEFYSGDASRHNRKHQGLGMAIARKFLAEQGGRLEYGNHKDGGGEVRCLVRVESDKY